MITYKEVQEVLNYDLSDTDNRYIAMLAEKYLLNLKLDYYTDDVKTIENNNKINEVIKILQKMQ